MVGMEENSEEETFSKYLCLARRFFWRATIFGLNLGFGLWGSERETYLLVSMAVLDNSE